MMDYSHYVLSKQFRRAALRLSRLDVMENGAEFLLLLVAVHEIPAQLPLLSQYATGTGKRRAHETEEWGEGEQFKVFNSAGAGSSLMVDVVIREAPMSTQKLL